MLVRLQRFQTLRDLTREQNYTPPAAVGVNPLGKPVIGFQ